MTPSRDPLLRLRASDPAAERRPTPESAARIDAAVTRAFTASPPHDELPVSPPAHDPPCAPQPPRRRAIRRAGAAAVGLATAAAFAITLAAPLRLATTPGVTTASAQSVLAAAALTARQEPGNGRWRYLRVVEHVTHVRPLGDGRSARAIVPRSVETWVGADGAERRRVAAAGPVRYPTPADAAAYAHGGAPIVGPGAGAVVAVAPASSRPLGDPARLPTAPERLAERLRTASRLRGASMPARIALLLRDAATPPAVRATLLELLRRLPGVTLRPGVHDPAGRRGDAVVVRDGAATTSFLFGVDRELLAIHAQGDPRHDPGVDDWQLLVARGRRADAPPATLRERHATGQGDTKPVPQLVPVRPR